MRYPSFARMFFTAPGCSASLIPNGAQSAAASDGKIIPWLWCLLWTRLGCLHAIDRLIIWCIRSSLSPQPLDNCFSSPVTNESFGLPPACS